MMLPQVSIISPSFNQAAFIARTLESVAAQREVALEHLIFDPGSTDGTREILKDYAAKSAFAKLFLEPDKGQADAINKGFARANGEIVAWLNTDDFYVDRDVLADVAAAFARAPDVGVIYGRGDFIDPAGALVREAFINTDDSHLAEALVHSVGILQPAAFFRRSLIERLGLLDASLACAFDHELWLRWASQGVRFRFLDRKLARATFHQDAKSSSLRARQLAESVEVVRRHYGFAPAQWVQRVTMCDLAAENGIVDAAAPKPAPSSATIQQSADALFRKLNGAKANRIGLLEHPAKQACAATYDSMARTERADFSKIIVTTFNDAYMDQGLTLIASVHRHEGGARPVFVYDLDLSDANKALLNALRNVFVVPYPEAARQAYPAFMAPKSYGYKCVAIHDARRFVPAGGLVLWVDAGVALARPAAEIFKTIDRDDVFFVDHDDRPEWPFFNRTFTHPTALAHMSATRLEMLGQHLCSCLIGYRAAGQYAALFDQAAAYALDEKVVVWDKHPALDALDESGVLAHRPEPGRLRRWRKRRRAYERASNAELEAAFGYLGHRQDQSIFSVLAARFGAPLQSTRKYCVSTERSSQASKLNWAQGEASAQFGASADAGEFGRHAVTIHHRGTYKDHKGLLKEPTETPDLLVVLGNGPSLKGFDFSKLKGLDAIGMNAAYRYWREVGWYPRYYACLDLVVGVSHKNEIESLIRDSGQNGVEAFLLRRNLIDMLASDVRASPRIFDFDDLRKGSPLFAPMPITTGSHATLFGALLGYRRMIIMGVDCNYVEKVDGAEQRAGTQLELTATPARNPNYFFDSYQVAGDKYNVPNPEPDLHLNSWRAIAPVLKNHGVQVFNGSSISKVDAFPFAMFDDVAAQARAEAASGPVAIRASTPGTSGMSYERGEGASVDETKVVATLFEGEAGDNRVMLDVGAHFGTSAAYFDKLGWKIHCFEPDSQNRDKLAARFKSSPNISIDPRAVSDRPAQNVSFFRSEQSTGISGLHAFHETHQESGTVEVTTVADIAQERGLARIDFLKIDVEGFDFSVLKGVPWDRLKPRVIECEFEDFKTLPMGFTYHEIAAYLQAQGYTVYVSEWHPIVRYGVAHQWRRLKRYPCGLDDPKAWGNLLAFSDDPGLPRLQAAFARCLKISAPKRTAPVTSPTSQSAQPLAKLAAASQWLQRRSPRVHALAKRAYRVAEALAFRPWAIGAAGAAILLAAGFGFVSRSWVIFALAVLAFLGPLAAAVIAWLLAMRTAGNLAELKNKVALLEARLAAFERERRKPKV